MASFVIGLSFSSVYAGIPWDTADIADDAITSDKIKNKQVKNADIRGNTIKTGKIRDGTITSADLGTGQVTLNKLAPDVPTKLSFRIVEQTKTFNQGQDLRFNLFCDRSAGEVVGGGGYFSLGAAADDFLILNSAPFDTISGIGWTIDARNIGPGTSAKTALVTCIKLVP